MGFWVFVRIAVPIITLLAMMEGGSNVASVGLELTTIEDAATLEALAVVVAVCSLAFSLIPGSP